MLVHSNIKHWVHISWDEFDVPLWQLLSQLSSVCTRSSIFCTIYIKSVAFSSKNSFYFLNYLNCFCFSTNHKIWDAHSTLSQKKINKFNHRCHTDNKIKSIFITHILFLLFTTFLIKSDRWNEIAWRQQSRTRNQLLFIIIVLMLRTIEICQ